MVGGCWGVAADHDPFLAASPCFVVDRSLATPLLAGVVGVIWRMPAAAEGVRWCWRVCAARDEAGVGTAGDLANASVVGCGLRCDGGAAGSGLCEGSGECQQLSVLVEALAGFSA